MSVSDAAGTRASTRHSPDIRGPTFIFPCPPSSLCFISWIDDGATPFPFAMGHHAYSRPSMWLQRSLGEHVRERRLNPWWPRVDRDDYPINLIESSDDEEPCEEEEEGWWEDGEYEAGCSTTVDA